MRKNAILSIYLKLLVRLKEFLGHILIDRVDWVESTWWMLQNGLISYSICRFFNLSSLFLHFILKRLGVHLRHWQIHLYQLLVDLFLAVILIIYVETWFCEAVLEIFRVCHQIFIFFPHFIHIYELCCWWLTLVCVDR